MRERTCCFTGHREIPDGQRNQVMNSLTEAVETLVRQGVLYFGCGGALGFDYEKLEVMRSWRK